MPRCKYCKEKFEVKHFNRKFCYAEECINMATKDILKTSKEVKRKEWVKRRNEKKIVLNVKKNKSYLQTEINKLSRKIDEYFNYPCIDCGKFYGKQTDAAHYHNSQGNENIRFNLHNLHSSRSECNRYDSEHKKGYRVGLINRYGEEYYQMVETVLGLEYKYLGLTEVEIHEKLKVVRKLNREFDKHTKGNDLDGSMMRSYFNEKIGIYK